MEASATDYAALPSTAASQGRERVLAACIAVFLVQYSQSQAMIAPFLAMSWPGRLVGPDMVGVIFSAYPLATAIATPLPPVALGRLGLRGMVLLGLCLTAGANLTFGIAGAAASESWRGSLGVVLTIARALGGVGAALSEAGCLTAVSTAGWGDDLGKALSAIEVTTGTGAALGAALAGLLYPLGGFFLPIAVGAALPLLVLPIVCSCLPRKGYDKGGEAESELLGGAASAPGASRLALASADPWSRRVARGATCVSLVLAAAVFEGLNPLLEPHLKRHPYGLDVTQVGALLAAICIVYTLTALPVGWLTDRGLHGPNAGWKLRALMLLGWAITLVAAVLLAPGSGGGAHDDRTDRDYTLWPLSPAAAQIALGIATPLLGAGAALVIIPSLPDMQRGLAQGADEERRAALCALWNGAYAGGSAIGPLLAVMLYARAGWASIVVAQALLSLGASALLLSVACL